MLHNRLHESPCSSRRGVNIKRHDIARSDPFVCSVVLCVSCYMYMDMAMYMYMYAAFAACVGLAPSRCLCSGRLYR